LKAQKQPAAIIAELTAWSQPLEARSVRAIALLIFLLASCVVLMYRPFSQIEAGDEAIWDYMAQSILRGQIPYRDVIEIKSPGSAYLSAAAMVLTRLAHFPDEIAPRLLNALLAGLLASTTFLIARLYLQDTAIAMLASLIPLAPRHFPQWMVSGTQPKLEMILFGMLALLLVSKERPFWAGFFCMLSCICWQPGLLFLPVTVLSFLNRARKRSGLPVMVAGALIPILILLLYFHLAGALGDLWDWTIAFNYKVYAPRTMRSFSEAALHFCRVVIRVFRVDVLLVALSVIGLGSAIIKRIGSSAGSISSVGDALIAAPMIYLAFCLINFQSGPDLIPLFPFIGIFAGWTVLQFSQLSVRCKKLPQVVLAFLLLLIAYRAATYKPEPGLTLAQQRTEFQLISSLLGPEDRIYVHGMVELLVLTRRPNLNPYIFLDWGKDDYIAARKQGGFRSLIEEIEQQSPKIVALARLQKVSHRAELQQWVEQNYDRLEIAGYDGIYFRKRH
jgi:hypothetical protein